MTDILEYTRTCQECKIVETITEETTRWTTEQCLSTPYVPTVLGDLPHAALLTSLRVTIEYSAWATAVLLVQRTWVVMIPPNVDQGTLFRFTDCRQFDCAPIPPPTPALRVAYRRSKRRLILA